MRTISSKLAVFLAAVGQVTAGISVIRAQTATDLDAQKGGRVYSLGMPPVYKGHAAFVGGWDRPTTSSEVAAYGQLGVMRDLGNPVVGILALGLEGYMGVQAREFGWGGRGLVSVPALHVTTGMDYNVTDNDLDWLLRLELPIRRGGLFGRGTQLRIDWLPTRDQTLAIGISSPLWGRNLGKTRPQTDNVRLERPPLERLDLSSFVSPESLEETLENVRQSALRMTTLLLPFNDQGGQAAEQAYARSTAALRTVVAQRSLADEIAYYHDELERACSIAAGDIRVASGPTDETDGNGARACAAARRVLLDEILLPYDRLLGERKTDDGLDQFRAVGNAEFARWVLSESGIAPSHTRATLSVFQRLVDIADEIRTAEHERWEDSRLVWLPLQLALRPEDHDTQSELDAIIEQATGGILTPGNHVWYVMNENFQLEMARSVRRAEDYHVLWIHDYRGKNSQGKPDKVAFQQTLLSYIEALTERVRSYDQKGTLPVYMIFLDQHYFETNEGRLFLRLLSDPFDEELNLPGDYGDWIQQWETAQNSLRAAVSASRLLQLERSQFGDDWLHNRIKVHVSITNPSDFSFQSFHMIGIVPVPDNMMRDHRKIAFYDVTDQDPYKGMAMYTGMGIGEHYVGAMWEDRAIILQGPAALGVRDAARRLLLAQGFTENEIPLPLRSREKPPGYGARVEQETRKMEAEWKSYPGRVMELHNETGYASKPINIQKAILYTLMPVGSILRVPDSLWQSYLYAAMLAGSALRGCDVLVIAPSLASAPSSAPPTMARVHGVLSALVYFRNELRQEIASAGGVLRVGLYEPKFGVGDLRGRIMQMRETRRRGDLGVFNPEVDRVFDDLDAILEEAGYGTAYLMQADTGQRPKLHLKANTFASAASIRQMEGRPEIAEVFREYIKILARETGPQAGRISATEVPAAFNDAVEHLAEGIALHADPALAPHAMSYMTVGSTNMNYRSMVMDGEVQVLFTGRQTLLGFMDFYVLEGLTEWIQDQAELDQLLPPPGGFNRKVSNLMRLGL